MHKLSMQKGLKRTLWHLTKSSTFAPSNEWRMPKIRKRVGTTNKQSNLL